VNRPWSPRLSASERRRALVRTYYDFEVEYRRPGWGNPAFVRDGSGLFRFHDGRFAFSREHADWALLRKRGG
jgi:hypothetical protein